MHICFLRHGEADWPEWDKPDDERPLTKKGRREMKQVAEFLARLKFCPDVILSSPLPRASQTADIAAEELGCEVKVEPKLGHGFNLERLQGMLAKTDANCAMIVGHEPDFSAIIKELTGGDVKLAKAGVALVEADRNCRSGELRWLFPPKLAKVAME